MQVEQEPKYGVNENGKLVNRVSGEPIPDDEPVFILRARDVHAAIIIRDYAMYCADDEHREVVLGRWADFRRFAADHPDRMKEPDTEIEEPPTGIDPHLGHTNWPNCDTEGCGPDN